VASYRETVLTEFKEFEDNLFIKYITAFLHNLIQRSLSVMTAAVFAPLVQVRLCDMIIDLDKPSIQH
jgi:hypothetical protein